MKELDYLVIGAGAAGLQVGYFMQKSNRSYVILEKSENAGSFFAKYPRHRRLISINKIYTGHEDPEINLRWDWNSLLCDDPEFRMTNYSEAYLPNADRLVDYLNDFAEKYQLNISYNNAATHIEKVNGVFHVTSETGDKYIAKRVIVASGMFKTYYPNIEGIELCDRYKDCSVDSKDYRNKRVLIIGKGNSGFEIADHLINVTSLIHIVSPSPIQMAWDTHFVGHLRAVNNNLLDTYQLKSQNAIIDAQISKIVKSGDKLDVEFYYSHADGEVESRLYDKIILAAGFEFDTSIFADDIKPNLAIKDRFPDQTEQWESTNISDLYYAGTLTQQRDYKKTTSAFIHGFRYNAECLHKILEEKYYGNKIPHETLENSKEAFTKVLMKRINIASSLWQQFGFICDVIEIAAITNETKFYESLPTAYVHSTASWTKNRHFILTLEFGEKPEGDSSFAINRVKSDDVENGDKSVFLHPVVRYYDAGKLIGEYHMIESLEADYYSEELHIGPLRSFVEKHLGMHVETINAVS
ncbi:NAD(P)-binding domain-containing protein [uncultured Kordia sp.]|uniref:NAD(P)-binding domain-containing protein n=1 Tax=uncultured Kordia sp. TaxID=507699 RepID=UPI00261BBE90|nr:NAD(P)-binding domain-containing protein [uncultured Kordia sp.]